MNNVEQIVYRLGEICKLYAGGDAPKEVSETRTDEYPFPIFSNGLENEGLYGFGKKATMNANTITVSARGTIGAAFFRTERFLPIVRLITLEPFNEKIDSRYLYYYLQMNKLEGYGTSQQQLTVPFMKKRKILVFKDINYQKKIATTLRNYDLLIDNNVRRIELLEEIASSIYKEWFARFRFPEYKKTPTKNQSARGWTFGDREDGQQIPSNWNFDELGKIAIFKRGKNITSSEMEEGSVPVIAAGLEPSGYHNKANVSGYNLTISASGANAGYLAYHLENIWAADCSYYNDEANIWFVYNALKFLQPVISNMQIGSAQPHVYAKTINRISTVIPTPDIIEKFNSLVKPVYDEILKLQKKNQNLIQQRDSLLPRLMSGKLSVEGKEIV